jgi:hypothetical protein
VVSKAVIHLDHEKYQGRIFTVLAENNSPENVYIQSATLNDQPLSKAWLTYKQITSGGTLRLVMGPKINPNWGSAQADRPPATMPGSFQYAALPAPTSDKPVLLPFPIRVICGSDEPVGEFVPDPNMIYGDINHANSTIDTSVPNAAPAAVYQGERYGSDFAYTFSVPKNEHYLVRLHFAEIFDVGEGRRIENIQINGQSVLANFDIFAGAGGLNKALVKEFSDIMPDTQGNIVIRVASASNSPDHNAKISGIEILK